jgi:hypothetical protein
MKLLQQSIGQKRCPRCGGPMYSGYPDEYSCLFCGEYVYARATPAPLVPADVEVERVRGTPRPRRKPPTAA